MGKTKDEKLAYSRWYYKKNKKKLQAQEARRQDKRGKKTEEERKREIDRALEIIGVPIDPRTCRFTAWGLSIEREVNKRIQGE